LKPVQWELSSSEQMDRQTDRQDEANSCRSQFCEIAQKLHNDAECWPYTYCDFLHVRPANQPTTFVAPYQ